MCGLYAAQFFTRVLMLGETSMSHLSEYVLDLILELYSIDSRLIFPVLPQLELKLKVRPPLLSPMLHICTKGVFRLSIIHFQR